MHVKWPINMVVSIIHRATGSGMATVGAGLLVWWLAALAAGKEAYATFIDVFTYSAGGLNAIGYVFGVAYVHTGCRRPFPRSPEACRGSSRRTPRGNRR